MKSTLVAPVALALLACAGLPAAVHADIVGFDGLSPVTWAYNPGDAGSPPDILSSDHIQFTTGPNNARSIWFKTPQNVTEFTASFTYRASSISASAARQGLTFALQNAGLGALGEGGGGLGYKGIAPSAAVTIETDTGPGLTYSGFYTGGVLAGDSAATSPVNAFNFTEIDVTITYNGAVLSVTMSDGTNNSAPKNYFVGSLSSVLGGDTAYVGFTAGTFNTLGAGGGSNQFLSNFRYTTVPAPTALSLLGLAALPRRRRAV